ncbi:MAG TPA: hypothetical protein VGQ65_09605 [Thermoanaerobaculia bacterium]|jgi:hypothetical protein|nr:hypothetical protein [Thermoanaerobaculia bacterium]
MDYMRWMTLNTNIHTKKLANICLPMTHDSGTFDLSDEMAPDPAEWIVELENALAKIAQDLNDAGILPYVADPLAWLLDEILVSLKGLTTATKQDIATQLRMGIRGFDFRMYNKGGVYYTYHGLQSTSTFESMLNDIRDFLSQTTGEIVYVNLSHYIGFEGDDLTTFGNFVKSKVGDWAYVALPGFTNDPFQATYDEIIGQSGVNKSRVILTTSNSLGDDRSFWPAEYCPPENTRSQAVLAGVYTDTTDIDLMIRTQVSQFQSAVDAGLPFANYMTMTPDTAQYVNIIVSSLYGALYTLSLDIMPHDPEVGLAVAAIATALLVDYEVVGFSWRTLEELSQQIDRQLTEIVDDNFVPITGTDNQISMIFCDFWETTTVVDLAINLSNDYEMEWSGNTVIEIVTTFTDTLGSSEGPSAAMFQGQLHMVYKSKDNDDMFMAIYDPASSSWISNSPIVDMTGGSTIAPQTNKSPSCETLDDVLNVVWKSADSDSIRWATWNGTTWAGGSAITIASPGQNPETNNSPYLARYRNELVMVHKYKNKDDIHWERFSAGVWSGGGKIAVIDNDDHSNPGTNKRPAAVEYNGLLYVIYKGGGSNNLYWCNYDGTDWRGNVEIKNDADDFKPKSDEGPGLARFAGSIYMLYKGEGSNNVWFSIYGGVAWNGNDEMKDATTIAPETNRSPWIVRVGEDLFLLDKGKDDDNLCQSFLKPVKF